MIVHNHFTNQQPREASEASECDLGNNTKCASAFQNNRQGRFEVLNKVRDLLCKEGKKEGLVYSQDYHRTCKCQHVRIDSNVKVMSHVGKASFSGVMQCGDVWACPVCSAKIQERRRHEIQSFFNYAYHGDFHTKKKVVMVTLTFPHSASQSLSELLDLQKNALRRLRSGRAWARDKELLGFSGMIRALEIVRTKANGWHPHTHELWIVNDSVSEQFLTEIVVEHWSKALKKFGAATKTNFESVKKYSVDVNIDCHDGNYLQKMVGLNWGADHEITKSSSKVGKSKKGMHPFEFLLQTSSPRKFKQYYLEYVEAMRGKRQLLWSRGLKDKCGIKELTNVEVVELKQENTQKIATLDKSQWSYIAKNNLQSYILERFEIKSPEHVLLELHKQIEAFEHVYDKHTDTTKPTKKQVGERCKTTPKKDFNSDRVTRILDDKYNLYLYRLAVEKKRRDDAFDANQALNKRQIIDYSKARVKQLLADISR